MTFGFFTRKIRAATLAVVFLSALGYGMWSSNSVSAFRDRKTAHIFPTKVTSVGFQNASQALRQELSETATFAQFSNENAASVHRVETIPSASGELPVVPVVEVPTVETVASSTIESQDTGVPQDVPTVEPAPVESQESVAEPVPTPEPVQQVEEVPAPAPVAEPTSFRTLFDQALTTLISASAKTVFATTTEEIVQSTVETSTPAVSTPRSIEDQIATCALTGTVCTVLEVSGFGVDGALKTEPVREVRLSFSFAYSAPEQDVVDEKMRVRYFHNGHWRSAGDIFLNKELANKNNGGYFTRVLDDVESWDDLSSLIVSFEYETIDNRTADIYLDSAWIDVEYKSTSRDDDETNDSITDTATAEDHIAFELSNQDATAEKVLALSQTESISFPFLDSTNDDLLIRSDKELYGSDVGFSEQTMYVSVTNKGTVEDIFTLRGAFPDHDALASVAQYLRNVPVVRETPVYNDVSYFCEEGWAMSSTTNVYNCDSTQEQRICSARSESLQNCTVSRVVTSTTKSSSYEGAWVPKEVRALPDAEATTSVALPPGYTITAETVDEFRILPGQTLYFKLALTPSKHIPAQFVLIAEGARVHGDLDSATLTESGAPQRTFAKRSAREINDRISTRSDFDGDELPEFRFKFTTQRSLLARIGNRLMGKKNTFAMQRAIVRHEGIETANVPVNVVYGENGEWTLAFAKKPRAFRPGKYAIDIQIQEGSKTFTDTVEFYWGVLAINTNKTIFETGETAHFMMAALDDTGDTLCEAKLDLSVTDAGGIVHEIPVEESGLCGPNNVVDVADYAGDMLVASVGTYQVVLTHRAQDGQILHRTTDSFEVRESVGYVVERTGPTRIYPKAPYTMTLSIRTRAGFTGTVMESLPVGTTLLETSGGTISQYADAVHLAWDLSLAPDEEKKITYVFDAPDASPFLYLFGPLEMKDGDSSAFTELRTWKVASDALGGYVEKGVTWRPTVAGSWEVKDLSAAPFSVPANAVAEIAVINTDVATARVAGVRHASSSLTRSLNLNRTETQGTGGFTMHVQMSATSSLQTFAANTSYITFELLGYWTDGYYVERVDQIDPNNADNTWGNFNLSSFGVASGTIAEMVVGNWTTNLARNAGVRKQGSALSRLANIHQSTTAGVNGLTMLVQASGTTAGIQGFAQTEGANNASVDYWLFGYWSQNPTGLSYTERFDDLTGPTASSTWTTRALNTFGVPANGIAEVSYANNSTTNGTALIGVRASGSTIDRTLDMHNSAATGGGVFGRSHVRAGATASANIEYYSEDLLTDQFNLLGYWSPTNTAPDAPTLNGDPFDSEKTGSSTPIFLFTASDPDGSSDIVYEIQWDDDATLDTAPLGDRTSDNETGCSPNCFINTVSGGDTSPFTESQQIRFTIQSSLVSGTTYYWRVRAKDTSGSNLYGDWSTVQSFTYIANTYPPQWYQTEDSQFDKGTYDSAETYGSNSVRLVTSASNETLVAYADATIQTPQYRLWNGSAWGAQQTALSVGGVPQWIVTKAAPTRNEYILGTQDNQNDVNVQVYDGTTGIWGNLSEVTPTIATANRRGFDIAYESVSGDAIAVFCDGNSSPSYRVWNGSAWSGTSTIAMVSANNCEYIKLASDPTSDEIILVERDTGAGYEAQVWDGSSWGNSKTMGSMTEADHEGIAVEYETSGDQAVVTVSNGNASSLVYATWSPLPVGWSIPTTQATGDDFEWGVLKKSPSSDNMVLCYGDQDDDAGLLRWDGTGWIAFQEYEQNLKIGASGQIDSRPFSCEYETTSGRSGYIMMPFSDTTTSDYQYWDGAAFSTKTSLAPIEDAWSVGTTRTPDGKILTYFYDNTNSRYQFTYWNGSVWSQPQTLGNSVSVAADPFLQPIDMVTKRYQPTSGTLTSAPITFASVPSRTQWGEILANVTEPTGASVKLQVLSTSGGVCSTAVPDGTLPGNSSGFATTSWPIDISGLSTTTYSSLCLKATLATTNTSNVPTLDNWTLTWQRQPVLTQEHFRWFTNTNASTPTDPWPSGAFDVATDTALSVDESPSFGDVVRLRMSIKATSVALSASAQSFALQYALDTSCTTNSPWQNVGAIGSTTAKWRGYDNASVSDGATISTFKISSSTAAQTYEEENDSASNPNAIAVNGQGEWDWVLQHNASSTSSYCFRMVTSDGQSINTYTVYPSLITNAAPPAPTISKPFNYEKVASTTPWFEFSADDAEGNDVTYQVQISTGATFSSTVVDEDSQTNFTHFSNIVTTSDKDAFNSGEMVRFIPTATLSNGTTYYWRTRAKDRNNSAEWSSWSTTYSFTVDTSVTISTWFQTTLTQFANNTADNTEATSTNDVVLTPPSTAGTSTGPAITFSSRTLGNAWGTLSWTDNEATGDIRYHIEYYNGSTWQLIPDADLASNAAGYGTSPISLVGINPSTYDTIRLRANFTFIGGSARLNDWTLAWGYAVAQPTQTTTFDNEKVGTTTPTFTFITTDPQNDDLIYEWSISSTTDFAASTTRTTVSHSGFRNTASTTDTTPFEHNASIEYKIPVADALVNGRSYWWRVRARDPNGANAWSVWSDSRSLTVDTSVLVSTWFQTTDAQFNTDTLSSVETTGSGSSGLARITTTIREAFTAYSEGTVQSPRYRIWNGTTWGNEQSGQSVGDTIRFVEAAAAPTRDEYIIMTQGATGGIKAQVYNGSTAVAGNLTTIGTASSLTRRGYDVAYETSSGDAIAVTCVGTEAAYSVWNGTIWTATSSITLAVAGNCEWVELAADPTSDEIVAVFRDTVAGATDYQALVWSGSAWGNSNTFGSQQTAANEGIAVSYEESGGDAVVAISNGAGTNFTWKAWNGTSWSGAAGTVALTGRFANGRMARDVGTDAMTLCYIDSGLNVGYVKWTGSAWGAFAQFATGPNQNNRPISCEYETSGSRDGYIMMPFSSATAVNYVFWNGSALSTPALAISTVTVSREVRTTRTGDGNILMVAYDDANTDYDFSYWNGTTWSTEQILEATAITSVNPRTIPIDIVARRYPSFVAGSVTSSEVNFTDGTGPKWSSVSFTDTTPGSSDILYQVEYYSTSTDTWSLISNTDLAGNSVGTTTSPIDISNLNRTTYGTIRAKANFACVGGNCPSLSDWTIAWSEGVVISGTIKQFDQSANVTSGTVAVAVNGVLQTGKTGAISGSGTWSISNVTAFEDDVITVFVTGAADANEAVGITKYDGIGDVTGMQLFERHLSLGSNDNQTITNTNIGRYDNSVSGNEDIFHDVDAGNDLTVCSAMPGCFNSELWIRSGTIFRPDSSSSGNVTMRGFENNGTTTPDGNTFFVSGSWDNNAGFSKDTSTVVFTATSTTETVDSTGATAYTFNAVTFGQTSGTATWNMSTALDVDGALTVNFGTLNQNGNNAITIGGALTFGASGAFTKGTATTTFDGTGTSVWTDSTVAKQDMGKVLIDGTVKTIQLGSAAKLTDLTIAADDTFSVSGSNYALEVKGSWTNTNSFLAQNGTVTFTSTSAGNVITTGSSNFYSLAFNGVGGNWSFTAPTLTLGNDFSIATGTVTLPTATTTIAGSFSNSGGAFLHNNGIVNLTAGSAKTITTNNSAFYDLTFNGSGSWSFTESAATSSRHVTITTGTVTAPSSTFAVGGSFWKNGGTFTHNSGTLRFTSSSAQTLKFGNSDTAHMTFVGSGGAWSFLDASATTTGTVRFEAGAVTNPSGVWAVGGSLISTSGTFAHNSGTVKFNSTDTGETVAPGSTSSFRNLVFDSSSGGWTITSHATSTADTMLTNASSFTVASGQSLAVLGTFNNAVGGSATTWTGSTLFLNSGTAYSLNTKTTGGDGYGTLLVGASTDIKMWNSSSTVPVVNSIGSLYSQDNDAVDGALYIWGEYIPASNEYWSYAADFDGTVLSGGSRRGADVRFASGATFAQSANTLQILGAVGATTTITNQGSGTYGFALSGGTFNAQYYSFRNLNATGVALTGTPTVTSLSNGDMELAVGGGALMTVAGTVIDANPALQILAGRFATTTAITGTNVTVTGTPSSYWWWRNTTGNFDGEAFDSDPAGDPGNARWDDSSFVISVAGTVYGDHGTSVIGNPPCDGSTAVVKVKVSTGSTYTGSCNAGTGAYSISGVAFIGDVTLTAYLDTNGGKKAVTVTKTPTSNITGMDLYENALIVRHEDTSAMTIADLALFDSSDDSDIFFTAATGSPNTLSTQPNTELYVWTGKTFAPDGNVTLQSGGSGAFRDGTLYLAASAVFTASSTESHSIGGGFTASTSALFTPAQSTVTFTATTSGKRIAATPTVSFYNLSFNGVNGGWNLLSPATTTVQNTFTVATGTVSGTGDIVVATGDILGSGTMAMTGGTVHLNTTGTFGNSNPWQFYNILLGNGSSDISTKSGSGTTTVQGVLTVSSGQTLEAGSSPWVLTGAGTPLVVTGTFTVQTAPFYFTATTSTTIADETFNALTLAPSAAGSPTFTLRGGTLDASSLTLGDGTNPVTVTANTNDPSINVTGSVVIASSSTFIASNTGALQVGGSWATRGTFTHSNGSLTFTSTDTGETIMASSSPFYDVTLDGIGGGWTMLTHATTSRHLTITNASSFTQSPTTTLAVSGTFTNSVGGGATTWTNSVLFLNSGTSYSLNTKTAGGDVYGTLLVGANTDIRSWNSSAATTTVDTTASVYSQDHAGVDGSLYIWGDYVHSSGSDYWSYATDFDGTALGGSPRQVDVRVASSSVLTFSGGVFDIIGSAAATTTIANQGAGRFSFAVSGGTLNASYYSLRNTDTNGLSLSGSPTVTSLSRGDFELGYEGGATLTVAGTVIDANPLKIFTVNSFATSSGITSGYNVRATGSSGSSWKFNLHYGNFDGESFDSDPAGDPGNIRWDDSASNITIQGNVYSDEGTTVSSVCDGSTPVVRLKVQGGGSYTSACTASPSGQYTISNVSFNPGDTLTVYLDTAGGVKAANVSSDPITNISDMHLYENRVIVRHEDTVPQTIAKMALYDVTDDTDIPFDATDAGTDTLVLPANTKLLVWDSKTFAPAGNITLTSGGSGSAWDGSLELKAGAVLSLSGSQTHSVGGSFVLGTGASMLPANSTITFTATTTSKTITPQTSDFYNIVFNGVGGNWAFSGGAASTSNDFTITNGTVTLPTGTTTVAGSFQNTGGTFMHNNGLVLLTSTASGKSIRANGSNFYNLTASGSGGTWSFVDTNATTSQNFTITAGTVNLPAGTLAVGSSFTNTGSFAHSNGTVRLTATASGKTIRANGSNFYNLTQDGVGGAWTFSDTNATTTHSFTITNGSTTMPAGTLAVGGSFVSAGTFTHNSGTVKLTATTTGKTIQATTSPFYNLTLDSSVGGWTMTESATTSNALSITNASSFTVTSGKALAVGGTFTNSVGGAATTWTGSVLYLNSGTNFSANTKSVSGDSYGTFLVGSTTDVRLWNSSAATTTVETGGSVYSQDHAAVDGALYVWGEYARASGNDYWSYATDFDGVALGGGSRQVNVRVATSSTIAYTGSGSLAMAGTAAATTTVRLYGSTGTYGMSFAGGTLNANYYQLRGLNSTGLSISGTPTITTLSNGDYELGVDGGAMITVAGSALDANASLSVASVAFGTSTGITSGYNVVRTGSPTNSWTFTGSFGNYDGESFDSDGGDACGYIRWSDSSCLFVSQEHYRWRNDDGGGDVPNSDWYNASWSKRQKIGITNPNATSYTNLPVKITVTYDADMQSDFDDMRFTASDGTTALSFWRERTTASASSIVWVLLPTLSASDSATVYLYYGNGSASAADDGDATFGFFDDFEDDNISEYSGNTSMFDVDIDFEYIGTYGLDAGINASNQTTNGIYRTGSLVARGDTIRFFQYVDASAEDEPCTYFGVQGSGSNYAVCLDQYPTEKVSIAENVTSNDGSGTIHASSSVTYTTGWYEVVVNWLSSSLIDVYVYDSLGALFVNVTTTDSSYSSGGIGYGYWGQTGGWDFMSSKPYTATAPTYIFGVEQGRDGATWKVAEDTALSGQLTGTNIRLRFSIQNTGAALFSQLFRLQYASKGSSLNCESVPAVNFSDVPTTAGSCGSAAACMTSSTQFVDGASTAGLLSYPAALNFDAGKLLEDPSNQTASSSVRAFAATEVEYNFQMTANATGNAYCFRTTNGGLALDNYARVPEVQILHAPTISNFTLNMLTDITLTEGATTTVMATGTVTDLNGYADIVSASSSVYRSGVGASCSADDNNCYRQSSCTLSNCSGNSCDVMCSADIQYFADATDLGTYSGQNWLSQVGIVDSTNQFATSSAPFVELLTLFGLSVNTASIDFDALAAGQNTGAVTEQTTVLNTGNSLIDIDLLGTDLTGGASTIAVGEIKYATSTFSYASCSICSFLTGSATQVDVNIPKPTSSTTPSGDDLFWGINVPSGTAAVLHSGTNTFMATSP